MTAPAWYRRRAPRAPLDTHRMLAAGGLIESPFRWCEPMVAPRRIDWMPWIAAAMVAGAAFAGWRML